MQGRRLTAACPPPSSPQSGPVLIPFTPIQKTADYSLRLYNAYPVAECTCEHLLVGGRERSSSC